LAEPAPLIEVSGSPRERGRQYGEQAAARIRRGVGHYLAQMGAETVEERGIGGHARAFVPAIDRFDPTYTEEMRGIAEGAGLPFEAVVLLNCRTEILQLAKRAAEAGDEASPDRGCTGLVCLPSITADGRVIHAQNWDWKAECAETSVVLRIRRDDGPDILTFTEAGGLARSGFNSRGIAITANYLECERDYRRTGVPLALIRRKVLQSAHLAHAMAAVYATPKSASNNMIVSHPAGVAIDFECAPDESFQVHPEDGLLVHANHWISPVALAKLRDTGIASTPDSLYRDIRVRELVAPHRGRVTMETVKAALFDDFETPFAVCRPPRPSLSGNLTATVAMIVLVPETGRMEVAMLPALDRRFTPYTLEMEPEARARAARPGRQAA
jgi:isopenicillin-N N-acyltransferase-like protein